MPVDIEREGEKRRGEAKGGERRGEGERGKGGEGRRGIKGSGERLSRVSLGEGSHLGEGGQKGTREGVQRKI